MKPHLLIVAGLVCSASLFAQNYKITVGDEIKLRKGTTDFDIISADNTGLYFSEARLKMKSYFVIGASFTHAYKLFKLDKNFNEVFDKEYKKELKGLDFHSFQPLENDLFMFATDYIKKDKLFKAYGAKIDKSSGDLEGDFIELGTYQLESKRDDYEMKLTPIDGGKSFLMVANISGKDHVTLGVSLLDKSFHVKQNTEIELTIDPGHYSVEDVQLTNNNKIVLLGREYDDVQVGKKKRKRLVFKQYVMSIYNHDGTKEAEVPLDSEGRFVINGKLVKSATGDLLLAGFYSNTSKKDDLDGFFINRTDPLTGTLQLSSYKEINSSMLGKNFVDAGDEEDEDVKENKKQKRTEDDDQDDFPNRYTIKSVDINPADNSIVITSEVSQYSFYTYTTSSYSSMTKSWTYTTNYVHKFTNKDILVINTDKDGKIKWLNDIPKYQVEEIVSSSSGYSFFSGYDYNGFFATGGGMPYYSSFASLIHNNSLILLLNDHTSNNVIAQYGDKVKMVTNFRKRSNTYGITIDLSTGKMSKKLVSSNNDDTILMPRHAMVVGTDIYLPSWRERMMAKTKLKFAKISVN